jgi:hypothetical protein
MPDEHSQEQLYCVQLLQALGLETWDDAAAEAVLESTIREIQTDPVFRTILAQAQANPDIAAMTQQFTHGQGQDDHKVVFRLLFCYDYFDLMHNCVSDLLRDGQVMQRHCDALSGALHPKQKSD